MASGFFAILDDIASLMDDIAMSSKLATRKTVGILGDDLAVNAEKATGFLASRELPVLWKITKGSFLNKLIILPIVFLLNFFFPIAITYVLIFGGFYLAYEGVEKIVEYFFHHPAPQGETAGEQVIDEPAAEEKAKIKAAITTDFILSIEIVIIALGSVLDKDLTTQIITVSIVAVLATIGVYGIVALIVRMDDAGYKLIDLSKNSGFLSKLGRMLVNLLPWVIKCLGIVGTIALLLVSGGIFMHNIPYFHELLPAVPAMVKELVLGFVAGMLAVGVVGGIKKVVALVKA